MTQRNIELLIGRLVTDEEFRQAFLADPRRSLQALLDGGFHLTSAEVAALMAMGADWWRRVAGEIDPRLQKAALKVLDDD